MYIYIYVCVCGGLGECRVRIIYTCMRMCVCIHIDLHAHTRRPPCGEPADSANAAWIGGAGGSRARIMRIYWYVHTYTVAYTCRPLSGESADSANAARRRRSRRMPRQEWGRRGERKPCGKGGGNNFHRQPESAPRSTTQAPAGRRAAGPQSLSHSGTSIFDADCCLRGGGGGRDWERGGGGGE